MKYINKEDSSFKQNELKKIEVKAREMRAISWKQHQK